MVAPVESLSVHGAIRQFSSLIFLAALVVAGIVIIKAFEGVAALSICPSHVNTVPMHAH
jgi:hypothetical protein